MALRLVQVNFKARDDAALGRFWADALGWGVSSEGPSVTNVEPGGLEWPDPEFVCIDVVSVADPDSVDYRASLLLSSESQEQHDEFVAQLLELGATVAEPTPRASDAPGTALFDPEGNPFRVLEPLPLYEGTGPIAAVVVECADPREMARFWGGATNWTLHESTEDLARLRSPQAVGPYLEFVRTPEGDRSRSRVHLDLRPYAGDDQAADVERLRGLGATLVDIGQGDAPWKVLTDPEGNEFCVLTPGG